MKILSDEIKNKIKKVQAQAQNEYDQGFYGNKRFYNKQVRDLIKEGTKNEIQSN